MQFMNLNAVILGLLHIQIQLVIYQRNARRRATRNERRRRRYAVHPMNTTRLTLGHHATICNELRMYPDRFFNYTRMSILQFDFLLEQCRSRLQKREMRCSIPPEMRLFVTLRFLATGDSPSSMALAYRIGKSTVLETVVDTCAVLWDVLQPLFMPVPSVNQLQKIAQEFWEIWNFPLCIGSIDGKHITIFAPPNSGSVNFNYKKTFSIVLLGVCDANYCFTFVDIGCVGGISDGGVLRQSDFGKLLFADQLNMPAPSKLPGSNNPQLLSHVFLGDEAFPLKQNLMRPFAKARLDCKERKVFNYRLSRARRVIENCFGILAARWRIFHKVIQASEKNVVNYVKATVVLHNFIMKTNSQMGNAARNSIYLPDFEDTTPGQATGIPVPGPWRREAAGSTLSDVNLNFTRAYPRNADLAREHFVQFLSSPQGSVAWQDEVVNRGVFQ